MTSTYRPHGYGSSSALKRAREPFRTRNAVTGTLLAVFVGTVWAYSISAVKQDTFDDIDIVASEKQVQVVAALTPNRTDAQRVPDGSTQPLCGSITATKLSTSPLMRLRPSILDRLAPLRHNDGRLIVWGAPAIDNIGSVGDRKSTPWEGSR